MGDYPSDLRIAEDAFRQRVAELQKEHGIGEAIHQIVLLSEAAVSACSCCWITVGQRPDGRCVPVGRPLD